MCDVEIFNENHEIRIDEKTNSPVAFQDEVVTIDNEIIVVETQTKSDLDIQENNTVTEHVLEDERGSDSTKIDYSYHWEKTPKLLCSASAEYQPSELYENFTKGCYWSPDGTCLLVPSEDYRLRIFDLPKECYSAKCFRELKVDNFRSSLAIKDGGTIYDCCWYPYMDSWKPETCCILSCSKESPVHLWDAFTGQLQASYRPYNQVDEVEAAVSVQFINQATEIWCGFKNVIRTFDVNRPGRQTSDIALRKSFPNVTGIISCIRENPLMPGLVAFGTYSKCIGLYKDGPICNFKTRSGVTQIEFSPCGTKMYSGVRRNGEFLCWDLRNPGSVLWSSDKRLADTNQRIQFSISFDGSHIASGGTNGQVQIWREPETEAQSLELSADFSLSVSEDCVNGVSLHKSMPILATSSGQRLCEDEVSRRDNGVKLWWYGS